MIDIKRTNSDSKDFIDLVRLLDADLVIRDGEDYAFYSQFNKLDQIKYVVLAYDDKEPVGCGAIKEYEPKVMEIKRMFVLPECRGKGVASKVLQELEKWANELSFEKCILETGVKQPEAIGLYKKNNYHFIPNYGQYTGVKESVCFDKKITS
ncbi:GNAT family N-acetyltransferase [Labilibaculum antarcticum]|uniref:GNAT family N-acetyltransferase n=1 Tax=Labilibaculum antarcticum TaxID=1717717 RepID=A0A1Y1CM72_9BACT|nr:GNAT family N-acetyltransferase [Labilibaculum antarcticum]BAX81390.1 GNAT family N-acetyltransferase [Labilibaculum antarcticum]